MWNVKPAENEDRGGFQDRDVGRTSIARNLGPEYGIDYARFAEEPDVARDLKTKTLIEEALAGASDFQERGIFVKNGFVFLRGIVSEASRKTDIEDLVLGISGVIVVHNLIQVAPRQ